MRRRFHVTYDIVTPDSAKIGDLAECGFIAAPLGLQHPAVFTGELAAQLKDACAMTLRDAVSYASPQEDSGCWFSEVDGRDDYRTGANETRSIHPPDNITAASYGRLRRLFGIAA